MGAMHEFDKSRAYKQRVDGQPFFDDGREVELLHYVYARPDIDQIRGSPSKVIAAIDEYGISQRYLMNVGEGKAKIVSDTIAEVKPKVMVELGGYIGYSALVFGEAMRKAGGERYISLERNPEFASVILGLINLAGLQDVVRVEVGSSAESIRRLHATGQLEHIDMMFLDHYKPAYTTDLKLCEELKLVTPGTVLAADNVVTPGNPPYLEYVRSTAKQKQMKFDQDTMSKDDTQSFADKTKHQYAKRQGEEKLHNLRGNPKLVYNSRLVESFEPNGDPDGVEVTRCVGEEQ